MAPTHDPYATTFPAVFARNVAAHPERPAIVATRGTITYADLNAQADRIAAALFTHGVQEPRPICLLFGQEIAAFAATIAVLKSGNFYIALDPTYPLIRLAEILADTGAGLLVTNQAGLALAGQLCAAEVALLNIDTLPASTTPLPIPIISPDAYAYIGYTSGSTGKAKGVIETHRNHLCHWQNLLRAQPNYGQERVLFLNRLSFSGGQLAFYLTLLAGATLYLYDLQTDGLATLPAWIQQHQLTVWNSVPSVFRAFVEHLTSPAQVASIRLLRLASDAVLAQDIDAYHRWFAPDCRLWFCYALTEVKTVTMVFLDHTTAFTPTEIPNGPPIEGMAIQIVDEQGQPLGPDQVGEIVVRSRYVSPGYWRAPELTAARFHPDPTEPGVFLVQTGDLGKLDRNGNLIHKGRKDSQVKVRGYRVELSEIEAQLGALAGVPTAAVRAFPVAGGEVRLAAYVVSRQNPPPTSDELRCLLGARLPDYMIPASFTLLAQLPVNRNGKIDRAALPLPGNQRPALAAPFVPPRTALEQTIAAIWAELLGLNEVGVDDDFFALGGNSLLAMRALLAMERQVGRAIPPYFFRQPTIAHLVTLLSEEAPPPTKSQPPAQPSTRLDRISMARRKRQKQLRTIPMRLRHRFGRALAAPAFRRSFAEGVAWLRSWCSQPHIQGLLYRPECQALRRFAYELGTPVTAIADEVSLSLVSRMLQTHLDEQLRRHRQQPDYPLSRLAAEVQQALGGDLTSPTLGRYLTICGLTHLTAAREAGGGIILVRPHTNTNYLVHAFAQQLSAFIVSEATYKQRFTEILADTGISYWAGRPMARAAVAREVYQVLQQGGIVSMTGDDDDHPTGFPVMIGSRLRHLPMGFAELALMTGATPLPIYSALRADGRLQIEILPALRWDATSARATQITQLMQSYGAILTQLWRDQPSIADPKNLNL